jgi:hypothetical protein
VDSLASFFRLDPDRLQALLIEKELGGHPWLRECGPVAIRELAAAMVQRLPEALDTRLEAIVAAAFREATPAALQAGAVTSRDQAPAGPPEDGATEIRLPPQRLQSRHRPVLELQVADRPLLAVAFEVSLEIALEGVVLHARPGRPRQLAIERAQASGLLLHERQVLARFREEPLALPPLLPLGDGPPGSGEQLLRP